jgi:hypothetical protein
MGGDRRTRPAPPSCSARPRIATTTGPPVVTFPGTGRGVATHLRPDGPSRPAYPVDHAQHHSVVVPLPRSILQSLGDGSGRPSDASEPRWTPHGAGRSFTVRKNCGTPMLIATRCESANVVYASDLVDHLPRLGPTNTFGFSHRPERNVPASALTNAGSGPSRPSPTRIVALCAVTLTLCWFHCSSQSEA